MDYMLAKINNCSSPNYWYASRIGDTFKVFPNDDVDNNSLEVVNGGGRRISIGDCIIVGTNDTNPFRRNIESIINYCNERSCDNCELADRMLSTCDIRKGLSKILSNFDLVEKILAEPDKKCRRCGNTYKKNLSVPNAIWNKIKPSDYKDSEPKRLCAKCTIELIEQLEGHNQLTLIDDQYSTQSIRKAIS